MFTIDVANNVEEGYVANCFCPVENLFKPKCYELIDYF